ncbi:hypothetical protein [Paenisporosarcina sp. TG20]|uniref:hypothetical protein n=1 Tax=Paenisporosarcina sp. TG20 TaxID=1211706 RepID=UPI000362FF57|nr:hypothetical protein [Paenisporosarcina sp. TG20]
MFILSKSKPIRFWYWDITKIISLPPIQDSKGCGEILFFKKLINWYPINVPLPLPFLQALQGFLRNLMVIHLKNGPSTLLIFNNVIWHIHGVLELELSSLLLDFQS